MAFESTWIFTQVDISDLFFLRVWTSKLREQRLPQLKPSVPRIFSSVPGSQNGYNHSGKQGIVGWLQGKLGLVNGQRSLNYLRIITEFISRPDIAPVVPMLSIVNELKVTTPDIGIETAMSWSAEAYETIRNVTGFGKGNGPYVVLHDGFVGFDPWDGFLNGADRVAWDFQ